MLDKLIAIEAKYSQIEARLSAPVRAISWESSASAAAPDTGRTARKGSSSAGILPAGAERGAAPDPAAGGHRPQASLRRQKAETRSTSQDKAIMPSDRVLTSCQAYWFRARISGAPIPPAPARPRAEASRILTSNR